MNKFTAFFKRHRRGIITTTAVLAFDVVMLLVVHPLIANIEDFNTRFFIVVPLAFVIYPAIFLAAGIYTGRDLKRRWHIAVLQVLFCIIGEIKFPLRLAYVHRNRAFILDYHADNNKMLQK